MKWMHSLERKYGRYAIRRLMFYIVAANAVVFVFSLADPTGRLYSALLLIPQYVLEGQLWRLITFIAIPPNTSVIWIFFALYLSYIVGTSLEHEWGAFKFNMYYLLGMLATILASLLTGYATNAHYLNLSLFLAFAHLFPDHELMIYFVLPVKVKYLAGLYGLYLVYVMISTPFPYQLIPLAPIFTYLLFFGSDIFKGANRKRQVRQTRKKFFDEIRNARRPEDNDK